MSYIDRNMIPGERILFRTKKHLIIFLFPVIVTLFAFYASAHMQGDPYLRKLVWLPWLVVLIFWIQSGVDYLMSDFAITNKRIMMREGFIYRHANELRLSAISKVNIDQSLLGQFFDYGTVSINAFGAYDNYSLIANAPKFQKIVNEQLDQVVS